MAVGNFGGTVHTVCTITLSSGLYENSIENLREVVTEMGRKGTVFVDLEPKISGDELTITVNAATLYVTGIQGANGVWYRFPDETDVGQFAVNAQAAKGGTNYNELGLQNVDSQTSIVGKVIADLRLFDGKTNDPATRKNLITLIFLVSEAARFFSMEQAMLSYIEQGTINLKQYKDTVTAWQKSTLVKSADVALPYLDTTKKAEVAPKGKRAPKPKGPKR
jgi:hypothetical protein